MQYLTTFSTFELSFSQIKVSTTVALVVRQPRWLPTPVGADIIIRSISFDSPGGIQIGPRSSSHIPFLKSIWSFPEFFTLISCSFLRSYTVSQSSSLFRPGLNWANRIQYISVCPTSFVFGRNFPTREDVFPYVLLTWFVFYDVSKHSRLQWPSHVLVFRMVGNSRLSSIYIKQVQMVCVVRKDR